VELEEELGQGKKVLSSTLESLYWSNPDWLMSGTKKAGFTFVIDNMNLIGLIVKFANPYWITPR